MKKTLMVKQHLLLKMLDLQEQSKEFKEHLFSELSKIAIVHLYSQGIPRC